MPELRIILLVVGVLFVAGIAGSNGGARAAAGRWRRAVRAMMRPAERRRVAGAGATAGDQRGARLARAGRDSLPVIELASASESGTRRALGISISDEVAVDVAHDSGVRAADLRAHNEPYIGAGRRFPKCACSTNRSRCAGRSSCSPGRAKPSGASSRCA